MPHDIPQRNKWTLFHRVLLLTAWMRGIAGNRKQMLQ